ncbi:putative Nodulation efficiency protein D [Candidatus Zixiibacteriota bacterium]|nr:putative Nodulation efficiency protein D [candidate division Zixibacteria bacterium]
MPAVFWLWLAAAVIFLIIEIGTPTLVFACFTVGSVGAAVYSIFVPDGYLMQIGIFAGLSIILIPLTRSMARKITKPSPQLVNVDAMIGRPGVVTQAIDPHNDIGQVRVDGQVWRASSENHIETGSKIKVEKVIGAKLVVSQTEQGI